MAINKELKEIIDELFFDDMIDLIEEMPANIVKNFTAYKERAKRLNQPIFEIPAGFSGQHNDY